MRSRKIVAQALVVVAGMCLMVSSNVFAVQCGADSNCDGNVNLADLIIIKSEFLNTGCDPCMCDPIYACPTGMVNCGGTCIDPMTDREHCGADFNCIGGIICGGGQICDGGVCVLTCQPGLTKCGGYCVHTDTDEDYCGSCTNSCASGEMCVAGSCEVLGPVCEGTLSPLGRWCDQGDGTVKDMTTSLVWLKDAGWGGSKPWADCSTWDDAHTRAGTLYAGMSGAGLSDGSVEGDWRLPTKSELVGIAWGDEFIWSSQMSFFTNVHFVSYWSSTTYANDTTFAWYLLMDVGIAYYAGKDYDRYVWPVRGGQ